MSIQVRQVLPDDYPVIESIEDAADQLLIDRFNPDSWGSAPTGSDRAAENGFLLIAQETETNIIVGFVHVLEVEGIAHLDQLSVLPQHGRRGYGRTLLQAAMTEAQGRGYGSLSLRTYADVPWNAPFYGHVGFIETKPATAFHQHLIEVEEAFDLGRYGRRVQMTATLGQH